MYARLFSKFEEIARAECARHCPEGFDVMDEGPQTFPTLCSHFEQNGKIGVTRDESPDTIFDTPEGKHAFMAWHDRMHVKLGAQFNRDGELAVFHEQAAQIRRHDMDPAMLAAMINILRCEVVSQFDYKVANGEYPQYQRDFTADYLDGRF